MIWLEDRLDSWADWGLRRLGALQDWIDHRRSARWRAAHPESSAELDELDRQMMAVMSDMRFGMAQGMRTGLVRALAKSMPAEAGETLHIPRLGTVTAVELVNDGQADDPAV